MTDAKSVAEQVQEISERWNPAPTDHTLERVVGVPTEVGDTRATSHVPMEELNTRFNAGRDDLDAQRQDAFNDDLDGDGLPAVPEDDDGEPDYDSMKNDDLKALLKARDLPVSGKHADLVDRLEEDDADGDDGDD